MRDLQNWNENTSKIYQSYNQKIKEHEVAKNLFFGYKVWYSPIILNPKILIIGINPGIGEQTINKNINFKESINFEYLASIPNYRLANQIKNVFREAGIFELLETQTVKTNFYHNIIKDQKSIKYGLDLIEKKLSHQYENESKQIIFDLISIIKPKYIVCEGKSTYDKIVKLYDVKGNSVWENNCGLSQIKNPDMTIFGCSRRRNNIKNKSDFSKLLKENIK